VSQLQDLIQSTVVQQKSRFSGRNIQEIHIGHVNKKFEWLSYAVLDGTKQVLTEVFDGSVLELPSHAKVLWERSSPVSIVDNYLPFGRN